MIPRYSPDDIAALFSDETRFDRMLDVELLAADALSELGVIPAGDAQALRDKRPKIDAEFVAEVGERERVTNHDTAAFVDVVQSRIGGPESTWVHYGLTSSDVVDTALCSVLSQAAEIVVEETLALRSALTRRAVETIDWPITGRTHGMHAEPTTFGAKFALFALQVDRDLQRMRRARETIAVGKLSGAVGTFSNIDPYVENFVCQHLGLRAVPATQVISRDRHYEFVYACSSIATTIEHIALEIRHLSRSEVGEAEEAFAAGQKGSSAMPHKRNPVLSERLCGLARVVRGYVLAASEDVALWHERDISHSSVERIILPDVVALTVYMLRSASRLIDTLVLHPERALENLETNSLGLVFSQSVLLAMVESGMSRDDAYRIVQSAAHSASTERRNFRDVLESSDDVTLDADRMAQAFDLQRLLIHRRRFLDALEWR